MAGIKQIMNRLDKSVRKPASLDHLESQRRNVTTELATQALSKISPFAVIPGTFAQLLNTANTLFFSSNLSLREQIIHGLQLLLSAIQVSLSLYLLMRGESGCEDLSNVTCRLLLATNLLYNGILLTGWIPGEQHAMYMNRLPPTASEDTSEMEPSGYNFCKAE